MPTGSRKVNITHKSVLSMEDLKDRFLDYLSGENDEVTSAIFQGESGVLDSDEIELNSLANDTFDLVLTNANKVVVQSGEIITLPDGIAGITSGIPFENQVGVPYYVGIKYAEVVNGTQRNPRIPGLVEYVSLEDSFGEVDYPNSVSDDPVGQVLTLVVSSVTENGTPHTARVCTVWLVDPVNPDATIAIRNVSIQYDGVSGDNFIEIPYSVSQGPLGQTAPENPISTTATDYRVFVKGASWSRSVDLRPDKDYAFVGIITGNGPAAIPVAFDLTDQVPVFINTLDRAYDGATGSGSGRRIFADSGAVEILTRTGSGDDHHASFRIERNEDTEEGICSEFILTHETGVAIAALRPITYDSGGPNPELIVNDPCVTNAVAGRFTSTRVGAGWSGANEDLTMDFAWVQGTNDHDGLYLIETIGVGFYNVRNLDGTALVGPWTAGQAGTLTILRPVLWLSDYGFASVAPGNTGAALRDGALFHGGNDSAVHQKAAGFYPGSAPASARFYNDAVPARDPTQMTSDGYLQGEQVVARPATNLPGKGFYFDGSNVTLSYDVAQSCYAYYHVDPQGNIPLIVDPYGRIARSHHWEDDFIGYQDWSSFATFPVSSFPYLMNSTAVGATPPNCGIDLHAKDSGGCAYFTTADAIGDWFLFYGQNTFPIDTDTHMLRFFARLAMRVRKLDRIDRIMLATGVAGHSIYFERDATAGDPNWFFCVDDNVNPILKTDTGMNPNLDQFINFHAAVVGSDEVMFWMSGMANGIVVDIVAGGLNTFSGSAGMCRLELYTETQDVSIQGVSLDAWSAWDHETLHGGHGSQLP